MRLTDEQVELLTAQLGRTRSNLFRAIESVTGEQTPGGEERDALYYNFEERSGLTRCVECSFWLPEDEMDGDLCYLCTFMKEEE